MNGSKTDLEASALSTNSYSIRRYSARRQGRKAIHFLTQLKKPRIARYSTMYNSGIFILGLSNNYQTGLKAHGLQRIHAIQ